MASILLLGLLRKWMRQPEIVGYLLAGVVVGPHVLGLVSDPATVSHMGSLGVTLLHFFIGMEISPRKLAEGWRIAVIGLGGWLATRTSLKIPFLSRLRRDHELQVCAALLACFGLAFLTVMAQLSTRPGGLRRRHAGGHRERDRLGSA